MRIVNFEIGERVRWFDRAGEVVAVEDLDGLPIALVMWDGPHAAYGVPGTWVSFTELEPAEVLGLA